MEHQSRTVQELRAFEQDGRVIVCYVNLSDIPDDHNCDQMGCNTAWHVKYQFKINPKSNVTPE